MARRPLAAAALLGLLAPLLLVPTGHALTPPAEPAHPPVWDKAPGGTRYVSMGDSFASGPGIAPQRAGGCDRSENNYASLFAERLQVASFVDASCSGATTDHFEAAQTRTGGTNPPQLDALSEDTTLVTFGTMGGNDIGLVQLATNCAGSGSCVPAEGTDPLAEKFEQVRVDLAAALAETQRRAPQADVMVVGYGTYLPDNWCASNFYGLVTADEAEYIQGEIDRLSDLLREVAGEAGAYFVDQREIPGAVDHTVCAWFKDQWVRGVIVTDPFDSTAAPDGALFHPSTAGMKATAEFLRTEFDVMNDRGEQPGEPEPTTTPTPAPKPTTKPTPRPTPTKAQRLATLKRKAASARVSVSCQGSRRSGSATLRVRGGSGTVKAVTFRAGSKKVAVDKRAPFAAKKKSATLRKSLKKRSAKVRAVVTFREHGVTVKRTLTLKKRPSCLR